MGSRSKPPAPPPLPPPPPPPPTPVDPEVIQRRSSAQQGARNRLRSLRTILTSPQGLPSASDNTTRSILGVNTYG